MKGDHASRVADGPVALPRSIQAEKPKRTCPDDPCPALRAEPTAFPDAHLSLTECGNSHCVEGGSKWQRRAAENDSAEGVKNSRRIGASEFVSIVGASGDEPGEPLNLTSAGVWRPAGGSFRPASPGYGSGASGGRAPLPSDARFPAPPSSSRTAGSSSRSDCSARTPSR